MSSSNTVTTQQIWNRVGYVEIYIWERGGKPKVYNFEGHDFKFRVSHVLGRMPEGNASVSICNVKQETANDIITLFSVADALKKRKTLKLYAGYADPENKNYKGELIATMDIINATISTPPPDIWLEITAVYAAWLNNISFGIDILEPIGKSAYTMTDEEMLKPKGIEKYGYAIYAAATWVRKVFDVKTIAKTMGPTNAAKLEIVDVTKAICEKLTELYKKVFPDEPIEFISDCSCLEPTDTGHVETPGTVYHFKFDGTLAQIPTKLSEGFKISVVWEERNDGKIYLTAYPDPQYPMQTTNTAWRKKLTKNRKIRFLDVDHGLIGIPKLKDAINLQCRCFLDGKLRCGDYVSVKSEMIPAIYEAGEDIQPANSSFGYVWGRGSRRIDSSTVKGFQIMKITYSGHIRGNEWFCDIEARTPYAVENNKETLRPQSVRLTEDISGNLRKEGWELNPETGVFSKKGFVKVERSASNYFAEKYKSFIKWITFQ